MKSPFPGMDPYIEGCNLWDDFQQSLISEIEISLNRVLPEKYTARLRERTYVSLLTNEIQSAERLSVQADVTDVSKAALLEYGQAIPIEMLAPIHTDFREIYIEIRALIADRPLVTTVEVLSPSNKRRGTEGWEQYQRKRNAHLQGGANLVEIDLLRGGSRMPMATPWPNSPYNILVSRRSRIPHCDAWRASFSMPLPTIPIPLMHPDPDVWLALQPMVDAIYERSRYAMDIDYTKPCVPPLAPVDEQWLRNRLADSSV